MDIQIEAEGSVNYDLSTNITTASKKVKIKSESVTIEAEQLTYDGNSGLVVASGGVKLISGKKTLETQTINFNLNDETGSMKDFTGKIAAPEGRNYQVSGSGIETYKEQSELSNATLTRCPLSKPDYLLVAKQIQITEEKVYLRKVKLLIKGIPVFYFPVLSLETKDDTKLSPEIETTYTDKDGLRLKLDYTAPVTETIDWCFRSDFSTKGDSLIGVGTDLHGQRMNNRLDLLYNFDGFWMLEEQLKVNSRFLLMVVDGSLEFSDAKKKQLGLSLTSKYWKGPLGDWQIGLLARQVSALDSSSVEYGGTYGGYRLNYKPVPFIQLGLLKLNSFSGGDYRDLLADYQLGRNIIYDLNLPLKNGVSLVVDGTYNYDQELWLHQIYRIRKKSCCFNTSLGWDQAVRSWDFSWAIKF